ncbi:MAG: leucine-rich repeat domain-containing protein [Spirochaetaceae bacterium]|jgi:hypothetical protein|nr:leucine-rich repeat domain-containing protein [Spirochaetaceae bacterium]
MMKKAALGLVAVIAAVMVVLAGCGTTPYTGNALTGSEARAAGFGYRTEDGTVIITGYTGSGKKINIPVFIDGLPVTTIRWEAFEGNQLTRITIPAGVTVIGDRAFANNRLTSITIPAGVTTIGDEAFVNNRLTSVTIPAGVTIIGDRAFANNRLTSITIPDGVATIEYWAFGINFMNFYTREGSQAGTYTSGDGGKTWSK